MQPTTLQIICAILFSLAILHTFSVKFFEHLAHTRPKHAGLWHLLGEVEVVFGFWALILVLVLFGFEGKKETIQYLESRNFTEPLFVFAIMVIAATRPILQTTSSLIEKIVKSLPLPGMLGFYFIVLGIVPLIGSFITEPAAMTLAALLLSQHIFQRQISTQLQYATLGILFVNISIGGTLTAYAAPPVLMVAATWGWDSLFMMQHFGWKAIIAVLINTLGACIWFRRELSQLPSPKQLSDATPTLPTPIPMPLVLLHFGFLVALVSFAHYPTIFIGVFLLFLGIANAYPQYQDRLILREGLLVALFLAGLVILGGLQQWWLQPLLMSMNKDSIFFGATLLTAITDNAALTYLGSLVDGLSDEFKYSLVAGAVSGGGLTIIANAPNPAGIAILRPHFDEQEISPIRLFLAASLPTIVACMAFRFL